MASTEIISVLDIGSSKINCYTFSVTRGGKIEILGSASVPANGISLGVISHFENAKNSIKKALQNAELDSGKRIKKTIITYVLPSASGQFFPYSTPLSKENRKKSISSFLDMNLFQEMVGKSQEIAHLIPTNLKIDGYPIDDFRRLEGSKLMSDIYLILVPTAQMINLKNLINELDITVVHGVLSPIASLYGAFESTQREHSLLVEIGAGITTISVIKNSSIVYIKVLDYGSQFINKQLSSYFQIDDIYSEELKKQYTQHCNNYLNKVFAFKVNDKEVELTIDSVQRVIDSAWEELLAKISIEVMLYNDYKDIHHLSITGDGAQKLVIEKTAEKMFNYVNYINFYNPKISVETEFLGQGVTSTLGALKYYLEHKNKPLHLPPWDNRKAFFSWLKFW